MPVTVRIPSLLRSFTAGQRELSVHGETVRAVIDAMEELCPGLRDQLLDERGVRRFVNVFVRHEDIRSLDGLDTRLEDGDELDLVPAIAGG